MNRRRESQIWKAVKLLDQARDMLLLAMMETGPENSREEVSPTSRSPQRDCRTARLAAAYASIG